MGEQNRKSDENMVTADEWTSDLKGNLAQKRKSGSGDDRASKHMHGSDRRPSQVVSNNLTLLGLFCFLFGSLEGAEGIYFDKVADVLFYSSKWNLLIFYDLSAHYEELVHLTISKLAEICGDFEKALHFLYCKLNYIRLS
ncbi:unnamed protein product [Hermetia illucens]|uniref:Uncharacterized protein n=1 Tax=Hermetia illucens TaxID=343691 RepID=A0A7R8YQL3_HERIL|nr:unnamed protein product [Hermetia illucens]